VSGVVRAVGANVKHFKIGARALSNATYAELVAVNLNDANGKTFAGNNSG
jgi:NADPH:quinone reductase-like Zn-dependent oxidoreductase